MVEFSMRNFIMKTLRGMAGIEPDYKVMEYASVWYDKKVLKNDDMIEIEELLKPVEPEPEEIPKEEIPDEPPEDEVDPEEVPEEEAGEDGTEEEEKDEKEE